MVMRDEREISTVRRQLNRLGMTVSEHDPAEPPAPNETVDVIVMDADAIPIKSDLATSWKIGVPIIALIGTETPSRLEMAARSAAGILSRQAAALGGTLYGAGGCVRCRPTKN